MNDIDVLVCGRVSGRWQPLGAGSHHLRLVPGCQACRQAPAILLAWVSSVYVVSLTNYKMVLS